VQVEPPSSKPLTRASPGSGTRNHIHSTTLDTQEHHDDLNTASFTFKHCAIVCANMSPSSTGVALCLVSRCLSIFRASAASSGTIMMFIDTLRHNLSRSPDHLKQHQIQSMQTRCPGVGARKRSIAASERSLAELVHFEESTCVTSKMPKGTVKHCCFFGMQLDACRRRWLYFWEMASNVTDSTYSTGNDWQLNWTELVDRRAAVKRTVGQL